MDNDKYFNIFMLVILVASTIGTIVTSITDANLSGATGTVMALVPLGIAFGLFYKSFKSK